MNVKGRSLKVGELAAGCNGGVPADGREPLEGSYFISTYPPFSTWSADDTGSVRTLLQAPSSDPQPLGIYVHVPFCGQRCRYCYYLSYADRPSDQIDAYLNAVAREADMYRRKPALAGRQPEFVYFGGGTPSLLTPAQIARLFGELRGNFSWDSVREVSFECAPQTVTQERIAALRDGGVTRLSLGVQQLDDDILRRSGRVHLTADVERAWPIIRQAGFDVVNVDLIVGLVGETERTFFGSLERVIDMAPESVTIYQLEIPLNTPLYRDLTGGKLESRPPDWDVKHRRLMQAFDRLEAARYTIRSGYAAVRDPERHSFVYQDAQYRGADLLGLGAASFSYLDGTHYQNLASLKSYLRAVESDEVPLGRAHVLTDEERLIREFALQLKLGRVRSGYFRTKFGVEIAERFREPLDRLSHRGQLTVDDDGVMLTRDGLARVDRLIPQFYLPDHQRVRYS